MAIKKKEGERLDDDNIARVIDLFENADKPCTITRACEELRIASNGPRLKKIIAEYKERKEREKKFRAANRGKPVTDQETSDICESYLQGESIKDISDRLYRSTNVVKQVVQSIGVPRREPGENYFDYEPLPDQCIRDEFRIGELVWSSRHQAMAEVTEDLGLSSDGTCKIYRVYVYEGVRDIEGPTYKHYVTSGWGFYAVQRAYDLGSLDHLREAGVRVRRDLVTTNAKA